MGLIPTARDISDVYVENSITAEGFRTLVLGWTDGTGRDRRETFRGMSAYRVHGDLSACEAISNAAAIAYLMGICRMFGLLADKGLAL